MKKHLIATAALATLSTAALAQSSVTVYGVMDAGIQSVTKNADNAGASTKMQNGMTSPSILGFKGSEDLGGGMKANFALEAHLSTEDGTTNQQGSAFFGRQANVGISGSFGSVALGRQYYPAVLAFAATDPRGLKETMSGLMTWALGGSGVNTNQTIDVFASKAVSYNTNIAGVNFGALYGFGGVAGSDSTGRQMSFGATYSGPVTLSAAYQEQNGITANTSTKVNSKKSVGIGYTIGAATIKANWMRAELFAAGGATANREEDVYGIGVNYVINPKNTLTVAYYEGDAKGVANSKGRSYIVSNDYALSKRTTAYALVGVGDKDASASAGVMAVNTAVAGKTNTTYQVGIKHSF
jgi:predicted porin